MKILDGGNRVWEAVVCTVRSIVGEAKLVPAEEEEAFGEKGEEEGFFLLLAIVVVRNLLRWGRRKSLYSFVLQISGKA